MPPQRNTALDFVRGACVLGMIVHHGLNYFEFPYLPLRTVRFVSGAFLFLAGFVTTHIYLSKYDPARDASFLFRRLTVRAAKILAICAAANIAIHATIGGRLSGASMGPFELARTFFFTGSYQHFSFALLIPIAYTLFFAGLLMWILRSRIRLLIPLAVLFAIYCNFRHFEQQTGYYLSYLSFGMLGAAVGFLRAETLARILRVVWPVFLIYLVHLVFLSFIPQYYPIYLMTLGANLALLYAISLRVPPGAAWVRPLILFGNYSLLAYLAQILILQVLRLPLGRLPLGHGAVIVAWILTTLLTWGLVVVTDRWRRRSKAFDACYRFVLG